MVTLKIKYSTPEKNYQFVFASFSETCLAKQTPLTEIQLYVLTPGLLPAPCFKAKSSHIHL